MAVAHTQETRKAAVTDYPKQKNCEMKVIPCIYVRLVRGAGIPDDVVREVEQWWTLDGSLIAERDPCPVAVAGERERCVR